MNQESALIDDQHCFGCGIKNPIGLHLEFKKLSDGSMICSFKPQRIHQGFQKRVHGGIISLILDEIAVNHARTIESSAVSADIQVRLRRPAFIDSTLKFSSKIIKQTRKTLHVQCYCSDSKANLIAEGLIVCVTSKSSTKRTLPI